MAVHPWDGYLPCLTSASTTGVKPFQQTTCMAVHPLLTVFDERIDDRGEALPAGDVHGGPPAGHGAVRLHGGLVQQGRHDVRVAP